MNQVKQALEELFDEATNGENEFIKNKHIESIKDNKDILEKFINESSDLECKFKQLAEELKGQCSFLMKLGSHDAYLMSSTLYVLANSIESLFMGEDDE